MRLQLPVGIGLSLIGVSSVLFASSSVVLLNTAQQTEQQTLEKNLERVEQALQNQLESLSSAAADYATWDDTYAFAKGRNPAYLADSIGEVTFTSSRSDWMAIARSPGEILYSAAYDAASQEMVPTDATFRRALESLPILFRFTDEQPSRQGMALIAERLTLLASRPILKNDGSGPAAGSFIFGQTLDADEISRLAESTRLSISFYPITALPSDEHRRALAQLQAGQPSVISPLNAQAIAAYGLIHDLSNQPVMLIRIDAPRPIYQQMLLSLRYLALSLVGASTVSAWIIWRLLERSLNYLRERDRVQQALQQESALRQSELRYREKAEALELTLQELRSTQARLLQSEKMSGLGQLVAGIAHEINNPVSFIYGNVSHARQYAHSLLHLLSLYQQHVPDPPPPIQAEQAALDLDFIAEDLPKLLMSMRNGAERIRKIVLSLRTFSHMDESGLKTVEIHHGIDSTLLVLQHRLGHASGRSAIRVETDYGTLPPVECYPAQLNQVFLHILNNAIDAIETPVERNPFLSPSDEPLIRIQTQHLENADSGRSPGHIQISITNNGPAIPEPIQGRLFEPFFTTKPVGQGTGLGLTMCYQIIVETHHGSLRCHSALRQGTEFIIQIPVFQTTKRF